MAHVSETPVLQAVVGTLVSFHLHEAADTSGLTLASFDVKAAQDADFVADPVADWGLTLTEVDSVNFPGLYFVTLVPPLAGMVTLHLNRGADHYSILAQVFSPSASSGGGGGSGTYGELVLTVDDGTDPIEGVVARVFASGGSAVISSGTTDANGQAVFTLPVGSYDVRYYKSGVTFSNPLGVVVVANDDVAPLLDAVLTTDPVAVSTEMALLGRFFDPDASEVLFGAEPAVPAVSNALGSVLLATIPAALGSGATTVRVRKPDPANPGLYLTSNTLTLVIP